jgi:ribonuclease VapC
MRPPLTGGVARPQLFALDAFALIGMLLAEPRGPRVRAVLRIAERQGRPVLMSLINFAEVLYNVEYRMGPRRTARMLSELRRAPIHVLPATRARTFRAARFKAHYRIGYADAFAAALAAEFHATLLTGDDDFRVVDGLVDIEWLPSR